MTRWLDVDQHSGVPIYLQIVAQVRHALEVGILRPGDQLPTVRQMAAEHTIAPNTIVKAYNELQRTGIIESRQGVGTVVAATASRAVLADQIEAAFERLGTLVRDAAGLGIAKDDLRARLEEKLTRYYPPVEILEEES